MAKGMNSQKATKKAPTKTPKEKKEEKREKKKGGYEWTSPQKLDGLRMI